jgi:hypothetical protein
MKIANSETNTTAGFRMGIFSFELLCVESLYATKRHKKLKKGSASLSFLCLFVAKRLVPAAAHQP